MAPLPGSFFCLFCAAAPSISSWKNSKLFRKALVSSLSFSYNCGILSRYCCHCNQNRFIKKLWDKALPSALQLLCCQEKMLLYVDTDPKQWTGTGDSRHGFNISVWGSRIYFCVFMDSGLKEWCYLFSRSVSICSVHLLRPRTVQTYSSCLC